METKIQNLIDYAKAHLELDPFDEIYVRNRLLEALHEDLYDTDFPVVTNPDISNLSAPDLVAGPLIEEAILRGIIDENGREAYLCKLMDIVSLRPSEIARRFQEESRHSPLSGFSWLERYNIASDYIKSSMIAKNIRWIAEETKGKLEITINLSKPEKSHAQVRQEAQAGALKYPKCAICPENVGYVGGHTARQNLRGIPLTLQGEPWFWQFSPYAYFDQHGIAINTRHLPMHVGEDTIAKLFDFVDFIPDYFIGCNAALPIIGGSILAHDHFQGGLHRMPMQYAKAKWLFTSPAYPEVAISVLDWYNSVVHLESQNRHSLEALGNEIIAGWKHYDDPENDILSETNALHNSAAVIARKEEDRYLLDLILRNNRTSAEYPGGLFHAHQEYYHIKSEGIGLIEAMGLFILPGRLNRQMKEVSGYLSGKPYRKEDLAEDMKIHQPMIERLLAAHGDHHSSMEADAIIRHDIAYICEQILDNTAVFKQTATGNQGFKQFLLKQQITEVK